MHLVWSSQAGAKEEHVPGAAALMRDPRVTHYWDPEQRVGAAFRRHIANLAGPAWDVWMLFAPGTTWSDDAPPAPTWWEHQLRGLDEALRLDPDRFARKAVEMSRPPG